MKLTISQALQKAIDFHKVGLVKEADRFYTAVLNVDSKHPDANHNLGVLEVSVGKVAKALPHFKTALKVRPEILQFWMSYIDVLIRLGQLEDAKAVFNEAKRKGCHGADFDKSERLLCERDG